MVKIIPAILTNDAKELEKKIRACEGVVDRLQIDIIDGVFASNKTIDPSALEGIDTQLNLDFHLMVNEPIHWVEKCVRAGADRIIAQIERMDDQIAFIGKVQELGTMVGLAIDLETPVDKIDPTILTSLYVVLAMSVKAGLGGQRFDPIVLDKLKKLNELRSRDDTPYKIGVDGGETTQTVDDVRLEGVDEIVIGKRIFTGDLSTNINKFVKAAYRR